MTSLFISYAKWGQSDGWDKAWYCFGLQPPPNGTSCDVSVVDKVAPICVGKASCDLASYANEAFLGDPCHPNKPLPLKCPAGFHVDYMEATGDNGSCDCESYCASDWSGEIKQQRPGWKGSVLRFVASFCLRGSFVSTSLVQ
jgi:hypothetical protein